MILMTGGFLNVVDIAPVLILSNKEKWCCKTNDENGKHNHKPSDCSKNKENGVDKWRNIVYKLHEVQTFYDNDDGHEWFNES